MENASEVCCFMLLLRKRNGGHQVDDMSKAVASTTQMTAFSYFIPEDSFGSMFTKTLPVVISGTPRSRSCRLA